MSLFTRAWGELFENRTSKEAVVEQNELSEAIVADVAASLKGVMRHIGESDEDDDLLDETKSSVRFLCSTLERLLFNGVKDAHFWPLVESLGVCLFFCANRQAAPLTAIARAVCAAAQCAAISCRSRRRLVPPLSFPHFA